MKGEPLVSDARAALGAAVISGAHEGDEQPDGRPKAACEDGEQQMQDVVGFRPLCQHLLLAMGAIGSLLF